jgi:hypothetical protein
VGVTPGGIGGRARFARAPWPNPSSGKVEMRIALGSPASIELAVFDLRGARVATVFAGERSAGEHGFSWDGRDGRGRAMGSGYYVLRLTSGQRTDTRSVLIQR